MVVVHDTPSEFALQMYEVSLKYLLQFSSYRVDTILWQTDIVRCKGKNNITAFNLHKYEMLNKMTNSTYGYNVLDNEPVVSWGAPG